LVGSPKKKKKKRRKEKKSKKQNAAAAGAFIMHSYDTSGQWLAKSNIALFACQFLSRH
jgi:hypothetical protein